MGPNEIRPTLIQSLHLSLSRALSWKLIAEAVRRQKGLIHGSLDEGDLHCAIGAFFAENPGTALRTSLVDEVATYNDSMPYVTQRERRTRVLQWLHWRLKEESE